MDDKLRGIIESKKDDREVAEFAGITLTLVEYDFLIEQAEHFGSMLKELEEQNKRYREALNSIMTLWKYSEDRTDFEWLAHKMSDEARKAMEEDE